VAALLKERLTKQATDLHKYAAGRIYLHPVTALEISSTDIRKQIAMGNNPRYLLPNSVYEYIKQHEIYHINKL
jgi:nicotinate-nucleotide adenylyltransferase